MLLLQLCVQQVLVRQACQSLELHALFIMLSAGLRHCEMFSSNTLSADRKGYKLGSTESPEYKP